MRVVVTGAAGFIGSHVCEQLLAEGDDVIGLDAFIPYYPRALKESNLSIARSQPRFTFHEVDLRTDHLEELLQGADAIIHEAAMPGLPASWTDFDLYMTCNVQATQRLLQAARATSTLRRFLYVSTSSVYGLNATGDESTPPTPVSPYGVTKLAAEQLCLAYARSFGLPVVACRYFSVFGPRQRPDMAYHIFIRALLTGAPIVVFGDGRQSRGNTYVADCVDATLRVLRSGAEGETYNVGGGTEAELIEVIHLLEELTGQTAALQFREGRPGDQRRTFAHTSKIRTKLGWEPRTSLEEGLRREIDWMRALLG